jgi:hypothetical protein
MGGYFVDTQDLANNRSCQTLWLTFPVVDGAKSYVVHAYGFNDFRTGTREINVTRTPPFPTWLPCRDTFSRDGTINGEFRRLISSYAGPASGAAEGKADLEARFAGMIVEVTVRY